MQATVAWMAAIGALAALICAAALWLRVWVRARSLAERAVAADERDSRIALRESTVEARARTLELREANLNERERALDAARADVDDEWVVVRKRLEEIADYTADEARQELLERIEAEARDGARAVVRESEARAREDARRRASGIVATAVQRVAVETTASVVSSVVSLPDDDLKGRIIGRDGRNIRAFEQVTGVDLIVDDTPGVVTLSSFDPVRRETARRALERLIDDGRIHPVSIESAYRSASDQVDQAIDEAGDEAAAEARVEGLAPELRRLLGQLEFRSSYGHNVRRHSIESALLAGCMAAELGAEPALARRCALLHDIGKAISHQVEGSHAAVGAEIARRLGESEPVCHAIAAHHGEVEPETVEAVLTQAADAVSASRPGARRDSLEQHCARMRRIEELCAGFDGVSRAFAMQAGREVRVMVHPERVDDGQARALSKEVAARLGDEVAVPGSITVTVIREVRARSTA